MNDHASNDNVPMLSLKINMQVGGMDHSQAIFTDTAGGADAGGAMQDVRARILTAASRLIAEGGIAALTTRAVAAAASVQQPTIYRLFGEKQGLLDAVAEYGWNAYVAAKSTLMPDPDPVRALRNGWDNYIAFGLANPAVFAIMHKIGSSAPISPAALAGIAKLRELVQDIAKAGRLTVPVERAVDLVHAAGVGAVATLLAKPAGARDEQFASLARDAVLTAILTAPIHGSGPSDIAPLAVALGSRLADIRELSPGERLLLSELLDRVSAAG